MARASRAALHGWLPLPPRHAGAPALLGRGLPVRGDGRGRVTGCRAVPNGLVGHAGTRRMVGEKRHIGSRDSSTGNAARCSSARRNAGTASSTARRVTRDGSGRCSRPRRGCPRQCNCSITKPGRPLSPSPRVSALDGGTSTAAAWRSCCASLVLDEFVYESATERGTVSERRPGTSRREGVAARELEEPVGIVVFAPSASSPRRGCSGAAGPCGGWTCE